LANSEVSENACWACKSQLKPKQEFCVECEHWQGPLRRFMQIPTTTLALLVALLSVFATAAPVALDLLERSQISLKFREVAFSQQQNDNGTFSYALSFEIVNFSLNGLVLDEEVKCYQSSGNTHVIHHDFTLYIPKNDMSVPANMSNLKNIAAYLASGIKNILGESYVCKVTYENIYGFRGKYSLDPLEPSA